ncbi:unnamed protein product [Rhodiola kirilowii]
MGKRERENPCGVCGHFHKYEEGEVCGICGHLPVTAVIPPGAFTFSAFPSEILPGFLYLGSYDNASRSELLKSKGISCILNTVPTCPNLYKHTFTYHYLPEDSTLQFDDAIQFIEQCQMTRCRVLVHCMSGKSRSAACVVAYLMKSNGWRLQRSYEFVKEKRPIVEITQDVRQQLQDFEQKIFARVASNNTPSPQLFTNPAVPVFNGLPNPSDLAAAPAFTTNETTARLSPEELDVFSQLLTSVSGQGQTSMTNNSAENKGNNNMDMS